MQICDLLNLVAILIQYNVFHGSLIRFLLLMSNQRDHIGMRIQFSIYCEIDRPEVRSDLQIYWHGRELFKVISCEKFDLLSIFPNCSTRQCLSRKAGIEVILIPLVYWVHQYQEARKTDIVHLPIFEHWSFRQITSRLQKNEKSCFLYIKLQLFFFIVQSSTPSLVHRRK